jgi:ribosomal protein S18 acetylase RimI-like enzyme
VCFVAEVEEVDDKQQAVEDRLNVSDSSSSSNGSGDDTRSAHASSSQQQQGVTHQAAAVNPLETQLTDKHKGRDGVAVMEISTGGQNPAQSPPAEGAEQPKGLRRTRRVIVGSVTLTLYQPEALLPPPFPSGAAMRAYVTAMAVREEWRRKGLARAMLRACVRTGSCDCVMQVQVGAAEQCNTASNY